MNIPNNDPVKTICYGDERKWDTRIDAITFFIECVICSEGSERERYSTILDALYNGETLCTDDALF